MAGLMIAIANSISSNYVVSAGGGFDPDAEAFIVATGTTNPTEQNAINDLVLNLKNANIWTKFNALYPFIGSTATSQKFNLKNPLDTNAAFRLTFSGGWTHSSNGATPNGTNAYANTGLTPFANLSLNSTHLSYYGTTSGVPATTGISMGSVVNIGDFALTYIATSSDSNFYPMINCGTTGGTGLSYIPSRYNSLMVGNRVNSTQQQGWDNNVKTTLTRSSYGLNSASIYIGARNNNGTPDNYGTNQCRFASIGSGLTDLEAQVFNQIVEGYQFALGRNINPSQSFYYNRNYNVETNAFLYSTQITDATTQGAVNTLVTDLKGYGIWTKMKAIYPLVGSTATQQKFNLVNSQDTNDAFRLTLVGGWTHSTTGMLANGSNAYAAPNLIPSSVLTTNNTHLSVYMGTDTVAGNKVEMGVGVGGTLVPIMMLLSKYTGNLAYSNAYNLSTNQLTSSSTDARGFYIGSRTSSTSHKLYKNASILATDTNANANTLPTQGMVIGALNSNGSIVQYTDRQYRFISIGDGLNDTEATNFRTAVQAFQTTLGRQV